MLVKIITTLSNKHEKLHLEEEIKNYRSKYQQWWPLDDEIFSDSFFSLLFCISQIIYNPHVFYFIIEKIVTFKRKEAIKRRKENEF